MALITHTHIYIHNRECRILEHTQKTLMHVYMAATTHHCHMCTAWTR